MCVCVYEKVVAAVCPSDYTQLLNTNDSRFSSHQRWTATTIFATTQTTNKPISKNRNTEKQFEIVAKNMRKKMFKVL